MFTGLIEDVGSLVARERHGDAGKLQVRTDLPIHDIAEGDSIAVNGACLTVELRDTRKGVLVFHTLAETLDRTNLGHLPDGAPVNLERAMRLDSRLGGHLVSGHIDATAGILDVHDRGRDIVLAVTLPEALQPLVIPKGSIAIDGISLTVAELGADRLTVHIIPHTWTHTNLASAKKGGIVNVEADMVGKYILRQRSCAGNAAVLSMQNLQDAGFTM
ncbi:MAG: riboflavin synthase [Candidatus Pacebacteria bacterium]|nr:riboflavin synthase [Candidatus Paceibacterota bacterium]